MKHFENFFFSNDERIKNSFSVDYMIDNNLPLVDFPIENLGYQDLLSTSFSPREIFATNNESINSIHNCNNQNELSSTYRDFSQILDDEVLKYFRVDSQTTSFERFPVKLHKIIERSEIDGYSDIISWLPHGRSFKIHKKDEFISKIMPKYFYLTKLSSFMRQLSIYGFHKSRKVDKGTFYNELFLRGRPRICVGINRLPTKKTKLLLKSEPNFYRMLPMPSFNIEKSSSIPEMPRSVKYQEDKDIKSGSFSVPNICPDDDSSMKDLLQDFDINDDLEKKFMNEICTKDNGVEFIPHFKTNTLLNINEKKPTTIFSLAA